MEQHQKHAELTEEMIRGLKNRIGMEVPMGLPFVTVACADSMRHFAEGYGDINPLYCDEDYGKKSKWGTIIGAPIYCNSMGISGKKALTKEEREKGKGGGLPGIHAFYSGDDLDFFRPIKPGDKLSVRAGLAEVVEKKSRFTGGRMFIEINERVYRNQRDELVAIGRDLVVRAERGKSEETGKYSGIPVQKYTPEQMKAICADYEKEEMRGARTRYYEDVNVGDELTPVVKGPWSAMYFIAFTVGSGGAHVYHQGWMSAGAKWYQIYKNHPDAFPLNKYGFPDSVARVHWEHEAAQNIGIPWFYDYGAERINYLCHVVTNWMGDEGWLRKLDGQYRLFNYFGDTTWVKGKVTKKFIKDGEHTVVLDIWAENQRGETHAPGHATVLLPSKKNGPVVLPPKPDRPSLFGGDKL